MGEGRTRLALTNIFYNFAGQFILLILAFISRKIFINSLSVEYLGINGLFGDILTLLSMADLGFNTAMVYSFYKPLAEKNYKKMAALTSFYKKIYKIIAFSVSILGVLLTPFLGHIVNLENDIPNLEIYYLLSLASVVISYLFVYRTSIITADQKGFLLTRVSIIITLLKTITQILILILFKNYIAYLSIGVIYGFLYNLIVSRKATKLYPFIAEKIALSKKEKKEIMDNIKSVFLYKVSSVLLTATDNIIISIISGTIVVGYYSNYLMVQSKLVVFYSLIFTSMIASIGNLIVKENHEKRHEIFQCQQVISFIICAVIVPGFLGLINDLILIWLGAEYLFPLPIIYIISINFYLSCALQPLWSFREATGLYLKTKWVMVLCAIINIFLSIVLGKIWGLSGILLASALSRLVTYIWYEPKVLFKDFFGRSCKNYFVDMFTNSLLVFALCAATTFVTGFYTVNTWLLMIIKGILLTLVLLGAALLFYRKKPAFKLMHVKFGNYIKRRRK